MTDLSTAHALALAAFWDREPDAPCSRCGACAGCGLPLTLETASMAEEELCVDCSH